MIDLLNELPPFDNSAKPGDYFVRIVDDSTGQKLQIFQLVVLDELDELLFCIKYSCFATVKFDSSDNNKYMIPKQIYMLISEEDMTSRYRSIKPEDMTEILLRL